MVLVKARTGVTTTNICVRSLEDDRPDAASHLALIRFIRAAETNTIQI